ncbi:MAG: hypothetical protein WDO15_14605 [Bacteroidota bacterium]
MLNEDTNTLLIQYLGERVAYELKDDENLANRRNHGGGKKGSAM